MNHLVKLLTVAALGVATTYAQANGPYGGYAHTAANAGIGFGNPLVSSGASAGPATSGASAVAIGPGFNSGMTHAYNQAGISHSTGLATHQGTNSFGTASSTAYHSPTMQQSLSTVIHGSGSVVGGSVSGSFTVGNISRSFSRSFGQAAGSSAGSAHGFNGSAAGSSVAYPYFR